jgi:lysophospholipase L1-like esterase
MPIDRPFRRSALACLLPLMAGAAGSAAAQTAPAWIGSWGAAPMSDGGDVFGPAQTVRHVVHTSVGGNVARVRFSNEFGSAPVTLRDVQIALAGSGSSVQAGTSRKLTFGGAATVTLAPGQDVSSDAVTFAVPKAGEVAVSYYLADKTSIQTYHQVENADSWVASGDVSGSTAIPVVSTHSSEFLLSGLDVQATPSKGTVVTIGASITDGYQSTYGANKRWPNDLATRLNAAGVAVGVVNEGITGNGFLQNGAGTSMLTRFSHDVLAQPGVHWVVISDNPINDILDPSGPPTIAALTAGLAQLVGKAHQQGVAVICSTLTPFNGYVNGTQKWTPALEAVRGQYNAFVKAGNGCDEVLDQDAATHDPADPTRYLPAYDSGDHLHPGDAGYQAIANAVNLAWFSKTVAPVGPQAGMVYHLVNAGSGLALDNGGSTSVSAQMTQWSDDPANVNQDWQLVDVGGGQFALVSGRSGMALDNGGSMTNGTPVTQYPLDPANINQHWRLVDVGNGVYHLDVQTSGDALDDAGRATLGSVVTQWHDDGVSNANQNWRLEFIRQAGAAAARRP